MLLSFVIGLLILSVETFCIIIRLHLIHRYYINALCMYIISMISFLAFSMFLDISNMTS